MASWVACRSWGGIADKTTTKAKALRSGRAGRVEADAGRLCSLGSLRSGEGLVMKMSGQLGPGHDRLCERQRETRVYS